MNAKTIAVSMAKGGVGKTVSSVNLSAALALQNKKVLLVDIDPQRGNATLSCGLTPSELKLTIANVISSFLELSELRGMNETIIPITDKLHILPANPQLEVVQTRLIVEQNSLGLFKDTPTTPSHETLKTILSSLKAEYDYIIVDCPPSVSMLTTNALVAAEKVILPMEAHYDSYESLQQIIEVIKRINKNYNPNLRVAGILLTKFQGRTNLCREVRKYVEENYGTDYTIFSTEIPMSIRAAELSSLGVSIFEHEPKGEVALAYTQIAHEVIANA